MKVRFTIAASLLTVISTAALAETRRVNIPRSNVSFEIPSLAELKEDQDPYPDFSIYRVKMSNRQMLGVYVGHAPQIPNNEKPQDIIIGGCLVRSYSRISPEGSNRDAYMTFSVPFQFPGINPGDRPISGVAKNIFHFFYGGLAANEAKQADAILSSITVSGSPPCDRN